MTDPITVDFVIAKKWPTLKRLVGQPATARFFPRQLFVEQNDFASSTGEFRGGKRPGGAASDNCNTVQAMH